MTTLLRGGWVVGWTGTGHEVLEDGCVAFKGNQICFVGFPGDPACPEADTIIDLPGRLISPGLINLHCIANVDLQPLQIDVGDVGFPRSKAWFESEAEVLDASQLEVSARFAVANLLRNGSTTFCSVTTMASKRYQDSEDETMALARSSADLGARAYVAHNFQDQSRYVDARGVSHVIPDAARGRDGLRHAIALVERLEADFAGTITGFIFPYTTETCSDELLVASMAAAQDLGVTLRSHFAQYPDEVLRTIESSGSSPAERLDRLGLLDPRTTLTHAIYLRGHPKVGQGDLVTDLKLLADSGTSVAHCPIVYSRRGEVLRSFDRYRRAGINLGLGTDTAPADIVGEMRMAATLAKVVDQDPQAGNAASVYHAATVGGATALGRTDIGRLEVGALADISVFDLTSLQLGVIDCPIKALVHYASGAEAEIVYVDGKRVVAGGDVIGVDDGAILCEAQAMWRHYKKALIARDPLQRSAEDLYPPALPIRKA